MNNEKDFINPDNKERAWESFRLQVDLLKDKLGNPVDEKIKEVVVGLIVHDFPTFSSCEGHLDREPVISPYVIVTTDEFEGWKEDESIADEMASENLNHQRRAIELLSEFYEKHDSPYDSRLSLEKVGPTSGFVLRNTGADVLEILPPAEQEEKLKLYRREMNDFAVFLKYKFFTS